MPKARLPTREELIKLCEDGIVPQDKWGNRDSARAQLQLGKAWALLRAGCEFEVLVKKGTLHSLSSDKDTWWITITYHGFNWFESYEGEEDEALSQEDFYIPTRKALEKSNGKDWY